MRALIRLRPMLAATVEPDRPVVLGFTVEITNALIRFLLIILRAFFGGAGL